jgi:hypothetical protein
MVNLAEWAKSPFSGLAHDLNASQLIEALRQLDLFYRPPSEWGRGGYCAKNASAFPLAVIAYLLGSFERVSQINGLSA